MLEPRRPDAPLARCGSGAPLPPCGPPGAASSLRGVHHGTVTGLSRASALRSGAGLLVVAGLAAMLWAGYSATPYYSAFEPRSPCLVHGLCDPAVVDAGQREWWSRSALAGALVLAGLALATVVRPRSSLAPWQEEAGEQPAEQSAAPLRQRLPEQGRAAWRRAALAGLVATGILTLGALPLALAGLAAPQLGAAVLAWLLVTQAWVLDWYAAQSAPLAVQPRLRLAGTVVGAGVGWLVGAGVAVAAGAASVASGGLSVPAFAAVLVAVSVIDGLVVAGVVRALLARAGRSLPAPPAPGPTQPVHAHV